LGPPFINVFFDPSPERLSRDGIQKPLHCMKCLNCAVLIAAPKGSLCFSFTREKIMHRQPPCALMDFATFGSLRVGHDAPDRNG
jgi:hypothetical protein